MPIGPPSHRPDPEIGVHEGVGADGGHVGGGIRVQRKLIHRDVPDVIGGKEAAAADGFLRDGELRHEERGGDGQGGHKTCDTNFHRMKRSGRYAMRDSRGNCGFGGREIANRLQRTRKGGLVSRWEGGSGGPPHFDKGGRLRSALPSNLAPPRD